MILSDLSIKRPIFATVMMLGLVALGGFMWALHNGQFDDLDGAANRIFKDDEEQ